SLRLILRELVVDECQLVRNVDFLPHIPGTSNITLSSFTMYSPAPHSVHPFWLQVVRDVPPRRNQSFYKLFRSGLQ
ncbi:MAG: hypothetical protein ACKPKO_21810, partial [Candidatus Fonsibacter sp.]